MGMPQTGCRALSDPWTEERAAAIDSAATSSGGLLIAGQFAQALLTLVAVAILARLLTPVDFGLVSMVTTVTAFLEIVRSFGVSETLLRSPRVTHAVASTMFWMSAAIAVATGLVTVCLGPAIEHFYQHQELGEIAVALGIGLMVAGFGVQHDVLLRRQMRFKERVLIDVFAAAAASAAAILAALLGWGYWAFVALLVGTSIFNTVGLWATVRWRPAAPSYSRSAHALLGFGGKLTLANLMQYLIENFDNVLIGRRWGAGPLGLYTRAYQLFTVPLTLIAAPLGRVAIPALAHWKDQPAKFRDFYSRTLNLIAYLTTPVTILGAVLSQEIVLVVLGEQWQGAGPILAVLAIGAIGQPIAHANGWVMIASGQSRRIILTAIARAAVYTTGFLIGVNWGALGVAIAYAVCSQGLRIPTTVVALRGTPVSLWNVTQACWRPVALSVALVLPALMVRELAHDTSPLLRIVLVISVSALALTVVALLWKQVRLELRTAKEFFVIRSGEPHISGQNFQSD